MGPLTQIGPNGWEFHSSTAVEFTSIRKQFRPYLFQTDVTRMKALDLINGQTYGINSNLPQVIHEALIKQQSKRKVQNNFGFEMIPPEMKPIAGETNEPVFVPLISTDFILYAYYIIKRRGDYYLFRQTKKAGWTGPLYQTTAVIQPIKINGQIIIEALKGKLCDIDLKTTAMQQQVMDNP